MKKESYIQYGLIAVAIGLVLSSVRESFEDFLPLTCPNGSQPYDTATGPQCQTESIPRICEPGYTADGEGCRSADGTMYYSPPGCPEGYLGAGINKCIKREPAVCPPGTEPYTMISITTGIPEGTKCVPSNIPTYPARLPPRDRQPTPAELSNICNPRDKLGGKAVPGALPVCLRSTTQQGASSTTDRKQESSPEDISTSKSTIQEVIDSLKPFRPPTAPSSDLEKERKEITELAKRNLFFIQAALFLVVLAMLSYFMFSLDTANLIAFGLLCVGIAMGFFLRR